MRGAVHHIDLTACDLARSATFYEEVLGFLGYRRSRGDATGVDWDLRDAGHLVCSIGLKDYGAGYYALSSPIPTGSSLSSCIGREAAKMPGC